jgi:hypothetical protein
LQYNGAAVKEAKKVTEGNKKFAGSAGIYESERRRAIAHRASIYKLQRVN